MITNMLNNKGKKVTLLAGVLAQGLALIMFGYCDKFSSEGSWKYIYFASLVFSRMV